MAEIRANKGRMIVKRMETETKSSGGIILTKENTQPPSLGTVLSVGEGVSEDFLKRIVIWKRYDENMVKIHDEEFVVLKEEEILAWIA